MPEHGVRSTYSQCPFQILLYDEHGSISAGTAFFYEFASKTYIITNWHNVSGKDPFENKYLSKNFRGPTLLKAKFAKWLGGTEPRNFAMISVDIPLYAEARPVWFEHPRLSYRCDVVAIPYARNDLIPEFMHNSANKISPTRIPVKPGTTTFIIGFPKALSVGFGLPIWKSGFIASEPHYDVVLGGTTSLVGGLAGGQQLPAFFIDALTREGMSGSPVFASHTGNWDMSDPYRSIDPTAPGYWSRDDIALGHTAMEFVGVYSGRVPTKEGEAALGICWRMDSINDICLAAKLGVDPHV